MKKSRLVAKGLMGRLRPILLLGSVVFCPAPSAGQVGASTTTPDSLAGRWEAETPEGDFVGISLELTTIVQGRPVTLLGVPEQIQDVAFAVFHRQRGHEVEPYGWPAWGWNWFTAKAAETVGGTDFVRWNGKRLTIDYGPHNTWWPHSPRIRIDLERDEGNDTWSGLFQRDAVRLQLVLKRPTEKSVFTGTWSDGRGCIHIARASDGVFTFWGDGIRLTGLERTSPHLQPPTSVTEFFGRPASADLVDVGLLKVDFQTFSALAVNGGPMFLKLRQDGRSLQIVRAGSRADEVWRRQANNSCLR